MIEKFRKSLFLVLATFYVIYLVVPIFRFYIGLDISMVSVAISAGLFLLYPKVFFNKISLVGLLYLIVLFFYYMFGKDLPTFGAGENPPLMRIVMATAFVIPNLAIYFVLSYLDSDKLYKYFCWMPIVAIILSFASFTPLIVGNKEILRQVTVKGAEFSANPLLPHYSLLHAYIFNIPALLLAFKIIKAKERYLFLVAAIYELYIIVQSSVTTTIILAVVSIVFSLIYDEESKNKSLLKALGIAVVFFLFIKVGVIDYIMNAVVDMYDGTASAGKMRMFRDMLSGNELQAGNAIDERGNLHSISTDAFLVNPIFGSVPVGGHSCLLDRLGGLGLLGFIPYILFLLSVFKSVTKTFRSQSARISFYVVIFNVLVMLYQKGLFGQECWLFLVVLVPSILHYIETVDLNKNGISNAK